MKLVITDAKYIIRDNKLYIEYLDEYVQKRFCRPGMFPYFFIPVKNVSALNKIKNLVVSTEVGAFETADTHKPCIKVECFFPADVKTCRDVLWENGVKTYESDIPFIRRWMIDQNVSVYEKPNILYFDVEADARKGIPRPDNPTQRIISIAGVDSRGNEFFICESDEHLIFQRFARLLERYPLRVGWFSNYWDVPYLAARARRINEWFPEHSGSWIDMRDLLKYSTYGAFTSLKLDYVAQRIIGKGKTMTLYKDGGAETLWRFFIKEREKLKKYNLNDALLVKEIEDEVQLLRGRIFLAKKARLPYKKMATTSARVENLALLKALDQTPRKVFPFKPRGETVGSAYKGGYVLQPPRGVFKGVAVLDYSAMYPSIIETFNVGIDTVLSPSEKGDYIKSPVGVQFMKKPRSIFASVIQDLKKLRAKHLKLRDQAPYGSAEWKQHHCFQTEIKLASNSIYGVLGAPFMTKFYDVRVASAITAYAREILKRSIQLCKQHFKLPVLYCDTDGFFVAAPLNASNPTKWMEDNVENIISFIEQDIKQWILKEFNVPEEYLNIRLKQDTLFEKIYFSGVKKRYIGVYPKNRKKDVDDYYLPDMHDVKLSGRIGQIKGYEAKKYNIFPLYKTLQLRVFEILMDADTEMEIYYKVSSMLRDLRKKLYSGMLDPLLVQQVTPQKRWQDYKAYPPYWEDLKRLSEQGKIRVGNAIRYFIVSEKNGKQVGKIVLDGMDNPKIQPSGYDHYWRLIKLMAERIVGFNFSVVDKTLMEFV